MWDRTSPMSTVASISLKTDVRFCGPTEDRRCAGENRVPIDRRSVPRESLTFLAARVQSTRQRGNIACYPTAERSIQIRSRPSPQFVHGYNTSGCPGPGVFDQRGIFSGIQLATTAIFISATFDLVGCLINRRLVFPVQQKFLALQLVDTQISQ